MSIKTRTHRQDITISPVGMNPNDQLTPAQKFPQGFVCNVRPDQYALMQQAAQELDYHITKGAPRNSMYADSIGVYVSNFSKDPRHLIERFKDLKLAAWSAARAQEAPQ